MRGRPVDLNARSSFVYSMHDEHGHILYIGVTLDPTTRWRNHMSSNPALTAATRRCKMRGPYKRAYAVALERDLILLENPLFNLEVDGVHKRPIVNRLNQEARAAAQRAVLDRYGIEDGA